MGFQQNAVCITRTAGADLSAKYGYCAKIDANSEFVLCGAGDLPDAILTDKAVAGAECPGQVAGIAEVVLGATVAPGDLVKPDANGATIKTVTAGDVAYGKCVEGGTVGQ
jgi:hypothetical protein